MWTAILLLLFLLIIGYDAYPGCVHRIQNAEAAMPQAIINSITTCQALREDIGPVQSCLVTRADFTEPVTL